MARAVELHENLVQELLAYVSEGNFTTQLIFQPLPTLFAQRSIAKGGNVLGLERNKHDGVLLQLNVMMNSADQEAFVYAKIKASIKALKEFASTIDEGLFGWVYVNYDDSTQDVIGGYGPENVRFMSDVAASYDPNRVFQELCVGGFKLVSRE